MCTAPITIRRGGGTWTVRKVRPSSSIPERAEQQALAELGGERILLHGTAVNQPLLAAHRVGDDDGGASFAPRLVQGFQDLELHAPNLHRQERGVFQECAG